jgi:hypothetical protein
LASKILNFYDDDDDDDGVRRYNILSNHMYIVGQQGISFSQDNLNFQFGILENLIKLGHNSSEKPFSPFILFSRNLLFQNYCRAKENDVLFLDFGGWPAYYIQ